jgi:hypothetical protein
MSRASKGVKIACRTTTKSVSGLGLKWNTTYVISPHAPRAGSYSPPGIGCKRLSKVRGFCIFFTERALISVDVRKAKSTLPMADGIGREMFILKRYLLLLQSICNCRANCSRLEALGLDHHIFVHIGTFYFISAARDLIWISHLYSCTTLPWRPETTKRKNRTQFSSILSNLEKIQ